MKLTTYGTVPVYTIAGASTARPLPEWLARKRKRSLKKDVEYTSRVELLQDFEFEEASSCVRVSEDGEWVMSTGTYKPQIHSHYLPHLSLSFARHTNVLNETFVLLSSDYSKSLHLQTDRSLEFHTPGGLHYSTRIPRYGRDLKYNRSSTEALVPSVGVNAEGNGEVFRLNLELGQFLKGFEVDVGGDDFHSLGGGALQGGINVGSVNCAAIAEDSHGLLAFGTSLGTIEFWDSRSRNRVSTLGLPPSLLESESYETPQITALEFHRSGLNFASGNSAGIIRTYDLRSPVALLTKDQGYDFPVKTLRYLDSALGAGRIMSADKKGIKIWDRNTGDHWAGIEPTVDLNHVEWVPDTGMFLTANEGRQQHAFFVPQLGPAPKWCAFLDNLVEEMAEDAEDPSAFKSSSVGVGEVYDNYKFLDMRQLQELSLDHIVGTTNLLRPYMHGYFVAQKLYEQARLLKNPDMIAEQRQKSIQEKIDRERESRIRGSKKLAVKVNRKYAETLAAREEAKERRRAEGLLRRGLAEAAAKQAPAVDGEKEGQQEPPTQLVDDRFKGLFENEDFEIDETSREFAMHNPSTVQNLKKRGLTAVEEEEESINNNMHLSDNDDDDNDDSDNADRDANNTEVRQKHQRQRGGDGHDEQPSKGRIGSASYQKSGHRPQQRHAPKMQVSSSTSSRRDIRQSGARRNQSFGDLASSMSRRERSHPAAASNGDAFGEKEITFEPSRAPRKRPQQIPDDEGSGRKVGRGKERRSASNNVFRQM